MKKSNQPQCGFSKENAYHFIHLFTGRKNYSQTLILMALLAVLMLPTSCKKDKDSPQTITLNAQDRAFFDSAAVSNMAEIELSNLIVNQNNTMPLNQGSNNDVRQFAEMMIVQHTVQMNNLKTLATRKGVTLPTTLPQAKQNLKLRLEALNGIQRDSAYMNIQVISHQQTVANFQSEISNGQDADVKNLATTNLPAIQQHLEMAQGLKQRLKF